MKKLYSHNYSGFSLVEMSVVLVIISTILGSMMVLTNKSQDRAKYEKTIAKIKAIDAQLQQYAIKGGLIPCPASRIAAPNSAAFGIASDCAIAVIPAQITEVGQVRIGAVPTRTLGLPDDYAYDEWGMRITYATNKNLATTPAAFTAYVKPAVDGIAVQDLNNNSVFDTNAALNKLFPAYILVSHGVDKEGATSMAGTATNACGSGLDAMNCGNTGAFRDTSIKLIHKSSAAYFDDVVIWRAYDYLDNTNDYTTELN